MKELRTEPYRALPSTVCRATKVFHGETTKRATEALVLSAANALVRPDWAESQLRSEPARFYVLGWWTRSAGPTAMIPPQIAVLYRQGQST